MGETARHEELAAVLVIEIDRDMLAEGRAADPHIDGDVAHRAAQHGDELSLRLGMLKMQAAQRASQRARQVILHERLRDADVGVTLHLKRLRKEAARIAKYFWLDDQHAGNSSLDDVHGADDGSVKRPGASKAATASASEGATSTANSSAAQSHRGGAFCVVRARRNEYPAGKPGGLARRKIGGAVARDPGMRKIKLHPFRRRNDHAGIGLAPGMIGNIQRSLAVGVMRTGEHRVEPRAGLRKRARDRGLHRREAAPVVKSARDAGLIADHDHGNSALVAARDRRARARKYAHILRAAEILCVFDDDAVAVEEEGGPPSQTLRPGIDLAPEAGIISIYIVLE